jgi:hypothetical protein
MRVPLICLTSSAVRGVWKAQYLGAALRRINATVATVRPPRSAGRCPVRHHRCGARILAIHCTGSPGQAHRREYESAGSWDTHHCRQINICTRGSVLNLAKLGCDRSFGNAHLCRARNPSPSDRGARQGQSRADPHDQPKAGDERAANRRLNCGRRLTIKPVR